MIRQFLVGGYDDNFSYLIIDQNTKEASIVDPCGNMSELFDYVKESDLKLVSVFITHSHFDHVEGVPQVLKKYNIPIYAHPNAESRIKDANGMILVVDEGDILSTGGLAIRVLYTPGHIDDAICFYIDSPLNDKVPALITGDTLFVEGCGRTNRTDAKDLYESLQRLKKLDKNTKVYTGHNYGSIPISTIEHELKKNRFFLAKDYDAFLQERFP